MTLDFFDRFSKIPQILVFMKIRQVGAELFHTDERTGMTKQFFERAYKDEDVSINIIILKTGERMPLIDFSSAP
jgi:hypothetical protein